MRVYACECVCVICVSKKERKKERERESFSLRYLLFLKIGRKIGRNQNS